MEDDDYIKEWRREKDFQSNIYLYEVGDKVRYKGKDAIIKKIKPENYKTGIKIEIELMDSSKDLVTVLEEDITLVHKCKPDDQRKCECGQWSDKQFNSGNWHSDWCPMYSSVGNKPKPFKWKWD